MKAILIFYYFFYLPSPIKPIVDQQVVSNLFKETDRNVNTLILMFKVNTKNIGKQIKTLQQYQKK